MNPIDLGYAPQIAAAAGRLEQLASLLRQRAGLLTAASAGCEWDGAGARAFRARAHETITRLRGSAAHLERCAAALRRHAARVADVVSHDLAEQAVAAERARGQVLEGVLRVGELVGVHR